MTGYNSHIMDSSRRTPLVFLLVVVAATITLPARQVAPLRAPAPPDYARSIDAWRAQREAELKADDGWLTLVGLYWLQEGVNRVGSDPGAAVPLPPGSAPRDIGAIEFRNGVASFIPLPGVDVRINGKPAAAQNLRPQPGAYDVLSTGTLTMFVIRRGERLGVRVRDTNSPARLDFRGLEWFPMRESCRVRARFIPYDKPTTIMIANVLGAIEPWPSPGKVVVTLGGNEYTLYPVLDGPDAKELFFIFRDETTGHETYPGGRFLYAAMPVNAEVILDFNKAHSPPCAFTPYATCPVPPKENALPVRVEAGEKNPHR